MASLTSAFLAAMSALHAVLMFVENQAMFDAHCSALRSVLHVPQMMELSRLMLR